MKRCWNERQKAVMCACVLTAICMSFRKKSPWIKNIKHNIEIVVDRLIVKPGIERRLTDSIENVLNLADGLLFVDRVGSEEEMLTLFPELFLPGLRHQRGRDRAEELLLQQPFRRVSGMLRTGL